MIKFLFLICSFSLLLACKKKDENPAPEPEPLKTGAVTIQVQAYDSLGEKLTDASGMRVRLDASNTVTTDPSGKVTFSNMVYDSYLPEAFREGWEAPPMIVYLNAPTQTLTIPIAKRSGFKLENFAVNYVQKDSITISFTLDKPVPGGKVCKVAIISSAAAGLNGNTYESADIVEVPVGNVSKFNIARLSDFSKYLALADSSKILYLNAIPVSYGEFETNLLPKPILLGDNLFAPAVLAIKKNWK